MDEWGLDVVFTGSQKALMNPPGVAAIAASPKAWAVIDRDDRAPRFFWDLRKAKASWDKGETAFTPAVSLLGGLREALRMIHDEGVTQVFARHARLARALRAGVAGLGLEIFPETDRLSDTVTAIRVPPGLEGGQIVRHLHQHYGTVIAGQRTRLSGKIIRLGTMGALAEGDILTDILHLESALRDLGLAMPPGRGVAAVAAALAS
jgi:aspartate aminotransferase-like enzyme